MPLVINFKIWCLPFYLKFSKCIIYCYPAVYEVSLSPHKKQVWEIWRNSAAEYLLYSSICCLSSEQAKSSQHILPIWFSAKHFDANDRVFKGWSVKYYRQPPPGLGSHPILTELSVSVYFYRHSLFCLSNIQLIVRRFFCLPSAIIKLNLTI